MPMIYSLLCRREILAIRYHTTASTKAHIIIDAIIAPFVPCAFSIAITPLKDSGKQAQQHFVFASNMTNRYFTAERVDVCVKPKTCSYESQT
jgi:hypothetical protein